MRKIAFGSLALAGTLMAVVAAADDSGFFVFKNNLGSDLAVSVDGDTQCNISPGATCTVRFDSRNSHTFGFNFGGQYHTKEFKPEYAPFEHCDIYADAGPQCHGCSNLMCEE